MGSAMMSKKPTCVLADIGFVRSFMALTTMLSERSRSPCLKNSSCRLDTHCARKKWWLGGREKRGGITNGKLKNSSFRLDTHCASQEK